MKDNKSPSMSISRRNFLLRTGWIAGGVTVLTSCGSIIPPLPSLNDPTYEDALSWIQMRADGQVIFYAPRMEMGQGVTVGLCQIIAEELNLPQSAIDYISPNTDQTPPFKMTVGSEGIAKYFEPVSRGAASLKEVLRERLQNSTQYKLHTIKEEEGGFSLPDGQMVSYADLIGDTSLVLNSEMLATAESNADKRKRAGPKAIGESWKDPQLKAIVTGQKTYSRDIAISGLRYGHIIHKPTFHATLDTVDIGSAMEMKGIVAVVPSKENDFVGIVAENPYVLDEAVNAVSVKWAYQDDLGARAISDILDVERIRSANSFEHEILSEGDLNTGRSSSVRSIEARYDTSFSAHAAMEPRAATVWVKEERVEVWSAGQDPFFTQKQVAAAIGRNVEDIIVYTHRLGGGFGGRVRCQASEEAAILSVATGHPVRVQWDRTAEFQNNYFQPAFSHYISAGVTEEGKIGFWEHDFVSSPILTGAVPDYIAWIIDSVKADEGTARGCVSPYQIMNQRIRYSDIRTSIPAGAWRGLGAAPNGFAIECMMDELAVEAGADPLEFRLNNLSASETKIRGVLEAVAEMAKWRDSKSDNSKRGISCAVYKGETAVAIVADIEIDHKTKKIVVKRIWCAQDCGLVINPDQVEAQVEGNVVWGCNMALKEKMQFTDGMVNADNFDGFEILRHDEMPDIQVKLIQSDGTPPTAVGEAAFAPVAPAITNAIFAATGRRLRKLPITYEQL